MNNCLFILERFKSILFGPKRGLKTANSFEVICGTMTLLTTTTIVKYVVVRLNNYLSGATIVDEIVRKSNTRFAYTLDKRKKLI